MALDLYDETLALLEGLSAARVPYAVAGGLALAIHGIPRATVDIDLLVLPLDVDRALAAAAERGFTVEAMPMRFSDGMQMRRVTRIAGEETLTLDLLLVEGPLVAAWESRVWVETERGTVSVVSRDGLIRMKVAAGRPQDLADLERLRELDR